MAIYHLSHFVQQLYHRPGMHHHRNAGMTLLCIWIVLLTSLIVEGLIITSPPSISGFYASTPAGLPAPSGDGFTAQVYAAIPSDCCTPITNGLPNGVALCKRGVCSYINKFQVAYAAGASAVIIINTADQLLEIQRDVGYPTTAPIPGTLVRISDGNMLRSTLAGNQTVMAQIKQDPIDPAQRAAMVDLAAANGFTWKKELTLAPVDTSTDDPCRVVWTISNAAVGSFTCDEYGNVFYMSFVSTGLRNLTDSLASLKKLHTVAISGNPLLRNFSVGIFSAWTEIYDLSLTSNSFSGYLPDFSQWPKLTFLDVSLNLFYGSISDSIGALDLHMLDISNNQIAGTIPNAITAMPHLVTLDVSYNLLEGDIPNFASPLLNSVDFSGNNFKGSAPTFASSPSITSIALQANNFQGKFEIGNLTALHVLLISKNQFTDISSLVSFTNLQTLDISYNNFSDPSILSTKLPITLQLLYASHNQFTKIPVMINLSELNTLDLSYNLIQQDYRDVLVSSLPTPDSVHLSKLIGISVLILSHNMLYQSASSGELRVCNYLPLITRMDLSFNNLNSSFEDAFPVCSYFNQMDFSNNAITGTVPSTLTRLPSLKTIDFRNNSMHHAPNSIAKFVYNYDSLTLNLTGAYSCPQVSFSTTGSVLLLDPAYFNFVHCTCQPGYRHLEYDSTNSSFTPCSQCGTHINCPGTLQDTVAIVEPGFYPLPSITAPQLAIPCLAPGQCNPNGSQAFECAEGSSDRLCSKCKSDYYRNGNICERCSPTGMLLVAAAVLIFVAIIFVKLYVDIRLYMRGKHDRRHSFADAKVRGSVIFQNKPVTDLASSTDSTPPSLTSSTTALAPYDPSSLSLSTTSLPPSPTPLLPSPTPLPPSSLFPSTTSLPSAPPSPLPTAMLEPENASPRSKSADSKFSSSKFADSKFANPLATSRSGALEPSPWYRTRSTISIAINYYQTLTILTKHTNLPSLVASIMEVAKLTNISKGGVGLECVGPFFRPFTASYSIIVLQPLLIVLGVLLIYGTGKLVIRFLTDLHQDLTGTYWAIICTHVILFFFNFLFMPLSTYILSVFPCAKDPLTGIEYLAIEPHLSCHVIPLAGKIIPLIFDMIALYVLFCSLLAWYQVTLGDTKFFLLHSFGFFFDHFKPEWVWMSIFILTRRLLHAITMGFTSSDTSFVPVVNVIIIAISIMCISLAKPYRQKLDNISEILSMVVLVVVYMIAIVISQFGQNELISVFYVINIGMTIWFVILLAVGYQHYWVRFVPHRVRALVPSIKPRGKKKAKKSKMDVTLSDFSSSTPKETQNGTAL